MSEYEYQNPLREGMRSIRISQPNTLVILGATGDLTRRKLIPALYNLYEQSVLPGNFSIIGFARRDKDDNHFHADLESALRDDIKKTATRAKTWHEFVQNVYYQRGDFGDLKAFQALDKKLLKMEKAKGIQPNRLFYLATPPSQYESIVQHLGLSGLNDPAGDGWTRIIIEKPFGRDWLTAKSLNKFVNGVFSENQVYRIDHYLGKETVQNILVFRFANGIFEPIWNRRYVDHIQITAAEDLGMEGRGKFFEETGILRDIVQNHMFQLLCLVAMEPPAAFEADAVRDEKVKVLRAVQPVKDDMINQIALRAQYTDGSMWGKKVVGYKGEEGVGSATTTETYVALKLFLNNWRWAGVPFYLRTGKRMPKKVTEIAIFFKDAPLPIFGPDAVEESSSNVLVLHIQPDEGITLRFDSKVPGPTGLIRPVAMDFRYGTSFGMPSPDAYERLLLDAMLGDNTLFTRADENETAWQILTPILEKWQSSKIAKLPSYPAGTWGPTEADTFINKDGRNWRRP